MKKKSALLLFTLFLSACLTVSCGNESNSSVLPFNTTNIYGQQVTQKILEDYDLTMINVWGTWCHSCIEELPDLATAHSMLPKNVNLISICEDAGQDEETLAAAKEIARTNNISFQVLIPDEDLTESIVSTVITFPTTIFVDSNGNEVGQRIIGVPNTESIADYYLLQVHTRLEMMGK